MRASQSGAIAELALLCFAGTSIAQCPFSLSNHPTYPVDSLSLQSCSLVSGTTYDLEVKVTHTSSNAGRFFLNVDSDASIRHLTFDVQGSELVWPNVTVTIRGPYDNGGEGTEDFALQSLESLKVDPDSTGYLSIDELWVVGDVGSLEFFQLEDGRLLNGSLLGPVDVREQEIYLPAAPSPRIGSLRVGDDVLGDITFHSGGRLDVVTAGGDIGSQGEPVVLFVTPSHLYGSGSNIGTIECANLYADIITLFKLRRVAVTGVFEGSITCNTVEPVYGYNPPGIFIGSGGFAGSIEVLGPAFEGNISITGDLASGGLLAIPVLSEGDSITITGSVESGSFIEIGGSLDGDIQIQGAQGLQGQILINAAIASVPPVEGEWTGSVSVGTGGSEVTIGGSETGNNHAPYYGVLSSTLGGGAVGLVPFNFHPKDSAPDHDSVVTTGALSTVQIHHYGPVAVGSGRGVRVFEAPWTLPYGFSDYSEVPLCYDPPGPQTEYWEEWDGEDDFDVSVSGRVVTITADERTFTTARAYQIIPDGLVCSGIPGTPDVVYVSNWVGAWDGDGYCDGYPETNGYGFVIPSKFDLNMSLEVEAGDIDTWLVEPVDFDGDDDADVIDLAELVDAVVSGGE